MHQGLFRHSCLSALVKHYVNACAVSPYVKTSAVLISRLTMTGHIQQNCFGRDPKALLQQITPAYTYAHALAINYITPALTLALHLVQSHSQSRCDIYLLPKHSLPLACVMCHESM